MTPEYFAESFGLKFEVLHEYYKHKTMSDGKLVRFDDRKHYDLLITSTKHNRIMIVEDYSPPFELTNEKFWSDFCSFYGDYYESFMDDRKNTSDADKVRELSSDWHRWLQGKLYAEFMGEDAEEIVYVDEEEQWNLFGFGNSVKRPQFIDCFSVTFNLEKP